MKTIIWFVKDGRGSSQVEQVIEMLNQRAASESAIRQLAGLIFGAFEVLRQIGIPEAEKQYYVSTLQNDQSYTTLKVSRLRCWLASLPAAGRR